jgi:vacuolar protein sorting-associated protein 35
MDDDQDKILQEALAAVKTHASNMQHVLDSNDLREGLKHSSLLLSELRTSSLSPRSYYELYMRVFDEMQPLASFFMEEFRKGKSMVELYERVQHASNILPRLYLLVTVGSVYIQTKTVPAKDILRDLIEMVKGVQHPMRGLFLRYYLNKCCKDKLPDIGNEYFQTEADLTDSIEFLLTNLGEMNRLWTRMQHTSSGKDKARREKERNELRVTVGENLSRLANLQGITLDIYKTSVLPKVLEIVTSCKDTMSQQYLTDCIIQVFPDGYHLATLELVLEACTQLQNTVDIKAVFINLMDRLANFAGESQGDVEIIQTVDIFALFKKYIDKIITEQKGTIELKKLLELQVAFLRFSLKCYPLSTNNVNLIFQSCLMLVEGSDGALDQDSLKSVVKLLTFPLETLSLAILSMNHYPKLMAYLEFVPRKQVAYKIVQAVVGNKRILDEYDLCLQLLEFIKPLLMDFPDSVEGEVYEFDEEQTNIAKIVHLIQVSDLRTHYRILKLFEERFTQGGPRRLPYTYPALIFSWIRFLYLARNTSEVETVLGSLLTLINSLAELDPEEGIRLFLQVVQCINNIDPSGEYSSQAEVFVEAAFTLYREELADSRTKFTMLNLFAGTFATLKCFSESTYIAMANNVTQMAAKMLRKQDQCLALAACTHLFWNEHAQQENSVSKCLKRSARIAEICSNFAKDLNLFVTVLNHYLYYAVKNVSTIETSLISQLADLISSKVQSTSTGTKAYFQATLQYVQARQKQGKLSSISV